MDISSLDMVVIRSGNDQPCAIENVHRNSEFTVILIESGDFP